MPSVRVDRARLPNGRRYPRTEIGEFIRTWRDGAGLAQGTMAEKLELTQGDLSGIEVSRRVPADETLVTMARVTRTSKKKIEEMAARDAKRRERWKANGRKLAKKPNRKKARKQRAVDSKRRSRKQPNGSNGNGLVPSAALDGANHKFRLWMDTGMKLAEVYQEAMGQPGMPQDRDEIRAELTAISAATLDRVLPPRIR
jgi:transcriptional regulator with XRE-family HTH domain